MIRSTRPERSKTRLPTFPALGVAVLAVLLGTSLAASAPAQSRSAQAGAAPLSAPISAPISGPLAAPLAALNSVPTSVAAPAGAVAAPGTPGAAAREQIISQVTALVARQLSALPGRVEIQVTPPEVRLAGAPCAQPEAFLPPGTRIAARLHAGVRCPGDLRWSLLLPVTIRQLVPAVQASRALAPGQPLAAEDATLTETDLMREAPGVLADAAEVAGQVLARAVPAGTILRREHFRARPVAQPGDAVTLRYSGAGFVVSGAGKVLQAAAEGQPVRVQTDSGRILTGIARSGRIVELGDPTR